MNDPLREKSVSAKVISEVAWAVCGYALAFLFVVIALKICINT